MHPQLQAITDELLAAEDRLRQLSDTVPAERWPERAEPERWSVAECVAHMNLTAEAYRPVVHTALTEARETGGAAPERYRRDFLGWVLWRTMGPPARVKVKTSAAFVPTETSTAGELVEEFERLQREQLEWVAGAEGLAIDRVKLRSPFDQRLQYNLYSCLSILPRHQHRHLLQAERVWPQPFSA